MEIIVFSGVCLLGLLVICVIIGASGAAKSSHGMNRFYYDGDDDFDSGDRNGDFSSNRRTDYDDGEFYGGIPFGDGKIVMTDDDDFGEEFGDELV